MLRRAESHVYAVTNVPQSQNYPNHIFLCEIMHSQFASNSPAFRLQANSMTFQNQNGCDLFYGFVLATGVAVELQ